MAAGFKGLTANMIFFVLKEEKSSKDAKVSKHIL